jgi:hypothetical protein
MTEKKAEDGGSNLETTSWFPAILQPKDRI